MSARDENGAVRWGVVSDYPEPHHSPGFRFWRDFMDWQRRLNGRLKLLDLTQPQFALLAVCAWLAREDGETTQHDVAELTGMDRMHISQIVSRLEADGLIRRHSSERDGRSKVVRLTERGREKLTQAMPIVEAFDREFFAGACAAGRLR